MSRTGVVAGLIAAVLVLGVTAGAAFAQDAKAIYTKECAKCHGDAGAGDGTMAQKLKDKPSDWTKGGGGLKDLDDVKIADSIKKGGASIGKSKLMPAYAKLSDAEVQSLVSYVKALKK